MSKLLEFEEGLMFKAGLHIMRETLGEERLENIAMRSMVKAVETDLFSFNFEEIMKELALELFHIARDKGASTAKYEPFDCLFEKSRTMYVFYTYLFNTQRISKEKLIELIKNDTDVIAISQLVVDTEYTALPEEQAKEDDVIAQKMSRKAIVAYAKHLIKSKD